MNIFLPYENDIVASVQSLDDLRLNKQLVEVYQLLTSAIKEKNGETIKGHRNHPVYLFYKNNLDFLAYYGLCCCCHYKARFNKKHQLEAYFASYCNKDFISFDREGHLVPPPYIPYYMEGSIKDPNHIRTTDNVSALFQRKLINKWNADKEKGRPPRWTNRDVPEFYKKEM